MPKTIKSGLRKLLYDMINKYEEVKREKEAVLSEKSRLLSTISEIASEIISDDREKLKVLHKSIEKLKILEQSEEMTSETQYIKKISSLTGFSLSTLWRIKKEGSVNSGQWDTPGKKRPHKRTISELDSFDTNAIRNKINEYYILKRCVPTLRSLVAELKESINFTGCVETLRQILLRNGFEFKKNSSERSTLIERYDIAAWRHRYLRTIAQKRTENKPIIFVDETYVHQNYKVKKSWQGPSVSGVSDKISLGKRYIIVHAGYEKGFIPSALLTFSTKSKLTDYHHDMNSSNFMKWLEQKLIPNLPKNSVVVMDNASYHVKQINKPPTTQNLKVDIQNWLTANEVAFEDFFTKAELLCLVDKNKPAPLYEVEELLKRHGHEVLNLPPYHCDLNPIEMIWSLVKRYISSKNIGLQPADMEKLIIDSFSHITPDDWSKCVDHVISMENKYKEKDRITDSDLEPFIINVNEDDTSDTSSDSFDGVEFLESDFDYDD